MALMIDKSTVHLDLLKNSLPYKKDIPFKTLSDRVCSVCADDIVPSLWKLQPFEIMYNRNTM